MFGKAKKIFLGQLNCKKIANFDFHEKCKGGKFTLLDAFIANQGKKIEEHRWFQFSNDVVIMKQVCCNFFFYNFQFFLTFLFS